MNLAQQVAQLLGPQGIVAAVNPQGSTPGTQNPSGASQQQGPGPGQF